MGRPKAKKVRTFDQLYDGDEKHDDEPKIMSWEQEFAAERKKLETRKKKLDTHLKFKQEKRQEQEISKESSIGKKSNDNNDEISKLKIQPNETLKQFSNRVQNQSRLIQAAKSKSEKNRALRKRREEKRNEKSTVNQDFYIKKEEEESSSDEEHKKLRSLPRILNVAERPPELSGISTEKKRFLGLAEKNTQKEKQMEALQQRVSKLYKKE